VTDDLPLEPKLALLERQVQQINRFPDQNPNPVMRMADDGTLMYANASSAPLRERWGVSVGEPIPAEVRERLIAAARQDGEPVEVACDRRTFSVVAVDVPDLGFINIYGTDVSAAKAIDRFPGGNPNPVMRMSPDGVLLYSNAASSRIVAALGLSIGARYPADLAEALTAAAHDPAAGPSEIDADGRTFLLTPVYIPEFDFINVYGTDITARKAINKFPDQNPNPVLRVAQDGRLAYANPASRLVRTALEAEVGDELPAARLAEIRSAAENPQGGVIELAADGRIYEVLVVSVFEYDFINLYGTDVTAAREVARANAENERLLLNILPASIAQRLRAGEVSIADRFDEVTVLFADVVDFTPLSARLSPDDLIALLNHVFSTCDRLADVHGLEKIKTVGDAYMVCGGLTGDGDDHPERVMRMGLAMLDEVGAAAEEMGQPLRIRLGMHVGPAVAGVIGTKKFIYDVWGDTVNTASRMESHGVPGRIQVTEATRARLVGSFDFEARGMVDVKGKGPTMTYLAIAPRSPVA
jgi:class 3 adenylate cyclase